jgi:hypothetical protein
LIIHRSVFFFLLLNQVIMKIKDHRIDHDHVREVQIDFHHRIIINNHYNEIIIDRREIIIIFMTEEIIDIDRIMGMIIEVVVVVEIDLVKR